MAAEVPNDAAFAAAVNAPVPQDQPVPYTGRWADTAHEQTPAGLDVAMDRWTPVIEAELTRVNGRITDLNTEVDDTAERCNGLTDRLTSLEFRTGAAVAEGANQVAQTAEAVIQTAGNSCITSKGSHHSRRQRTAGQQLRGQVHLWDQCRDPQRLRRRRGGIPREARQTHGRAWDRSSLR